MEIESSTIDRAAELLGKLRAGISEALVGQARVVEEVVLALVSSGHVLIEGVPGLGKTLLMRAMSQALQHSPWIPTFIGNSASASWIALGVIFPERQSLERPHRLPCDKRPRGHPGAAPPDV